MRLEALRRFSLVYMIVQWPPQRPAMAGRARIAVADLPQLCVAVVERFGGARRRFGVGPAQAEGSHPRGH